MLTNDQILRIAGAELVDAHGKETFDVGQHAVQAVVSMRLIGSVEQQPVQLVTPTVQIPLLAVLALVAERGGIKAGSLFDLVVDAAAQAIDAGEPVGDYFEHSKAALRVAKERVLARLDKVERSGALRRIVEVSDIDVQAVSFSAGPPVKPRRRRT